MNRRFEDTMIGKIIRFWPLILSALALSMAYGALSYSVKDHIATDDDRVKVVFKRVNECELTIAKHDALLNEIKEFNREARVDIKEILRRLR